jgi:methyl-accepting chemotaxis protein
VLVTVHAGLLIGAGALLPAPAACGIALAEGGLLATAALALSARGSWGRDPQCRSLWQDRAAAIVNRFGNAVGVFQTATPVSEILRAQLASVVDDTASASARIVSELQSLDAAIGAMLEYVASRATARDSLAADAETTSAANQRALDAFQQYLNDREREVHAESAELAAVVSDTTTLRHHARAVHDVAFQTNILSLNAAITAAHAGEHGRGFAVVAEQVRSLSVESDRAAAEVGAGIGRVSTRVERQLAARAKRGAEEVTTVRTLAAQLARVSADHGMLLREHGDVLQHLDARSKDLALMIMETLSTLQFQDIARQRIEHVAAALEGLERGTLRIEDLAPGYVMEAQRKIHAAVVGTRRTAEGGAKAVELF